MFRLILLPLLCGATVLPLGRADLLAGSDTVVRAKVVSQAPVRSERSGRILTRSRLSVLETYKGAARPELELEQMGGTLEGATLVVPGDARVEVGEEAVLFLRCKGSPRCHLYGLAMGKFGIRADPSTGKKLAVRSLAGLVDLNGRALADDALPLEELERELRRRR